MVMLTRDTLRKPRVAIIGAGAGGLTMAIRLKLRLNYDSCTIFEKGPDVGGTWRDNIYPGCSSDSPMVIYSLSTDKYDWPHSHGYYGDIQNYWKGLTEKYKLYPNIQFNTKVTRAVWDDITKVYRIDLENVLTGECRTVESEILVSAIGVLEVPRFATIPGRESFKGVMFHSARWDYNVDLRNKRVAVIGNGASATQFVPRITEDPSVQVTEFCRTPNWFLPPVRVEFSGFRRWIFRNVPYVHLFWRWVHLGRNELFYLSTFANDYLRGLTATLVKKYIESAAPKEQLEQLIPKYPLGCKRVIFDTDFLKALHRPNLDLNWDGVEKIVEDGILTKKGEMIPFDVIIFATGYAGDKFPLEVHGTKGAIQGYFDEKEGPQAYLGTTFPNFPNFFTVFGPNTATGHTSVIFTNECQANYISQLVKPILDRNVATVEVKTEPTDAYNEKIQTRLSKTQYPHCHSWYRVGGKGKITNIFPGTSSLFWIWLLRPRWEDYTGLGFDEWIARRRKERRRKMLWSTILAFLALGTAFALRRHTSFRDFVSWIRSVRA